jgi:hypothetical protein
MADMAGSIDFFARFTSVFANPRFTQAQPDDLGGLQLPGGRYPAASL